MTNQAHSYQYWYIISKYFLLALKSPLIQDKQATKTRPEFPQNSIKIRPKRNEYYKINQGKMP